MTDHVRTQIRTNAKIALIGLDTTGINVFTSRVSPYQTSELPALNISMADEDIEIGSMGVNRTVDREAELVVTATVKLADSFEDVRDRIIKEVEIAIAAAQTLGGVAKYVQLTAIQTENDDETEVPVASARMIFRVPYFTALNAPDVAF